VDDRGFVLKGVVSTAVVSQETGMAEGRATARITSGADPVNRVASANVTPHLEMTSICSASGMDRVTQEKSGEEIPTSGSAVVAHSRRGFSDGLHTTRIGHVLQQTEDRHTCTRCPGKARAAHRRHDAMVSSRLMNSYPPITFTWYVGITRRPRPSRMVTRRRRTVASRPGRGRAAPVVLPRDG
jgi:hypothetical protein